MCEIAFFLLLGLERWGGLLRYQHLQYLQVLISSQVPTGVTDFLVIAITVTKCKHVEVFLFQQTGTRLVRETILSQ